MAVPLLTRRDAPGWGEGDQAIPETLSLPVLCGPQSRLGRLLTTLQVVRRRDPRFSGRACEGYPRRVLLGPRAHRGLQPRPGNLPPLDRTALAGRHRGL